MAATKPVPTKKAFAVGELHLVGEALGPVPDDNADTDNELPPVQAIPSAAGGPTSSDDNPIDNTGLDIPKFLRRTTDNNKLSWMTTPAESEATGASAIGEVHLVGEGIGPAADDTSVCTNTNNEPPDDQTIEPHEFEYTPEERAALDEANEAFAPIIEAVETVEDIERWVPPVVKGVRALRDRAMRETGALNYQDGRYKRAFGDLLNAEPIGPWLLDPHRRPLLDAVHYLGSDDAYIDEFIEWRRTKITTKQREGWRKLPTLVDHFTRWQSGITPSKDRRTPDQKAIERVRADGHKADQAREREVERARQELVTKTVETTDTLWTVLRQAGPEKFVQALKEHDAKDYARTVHQLLAVWLREPAS
jgi:hypothetical protein